jgi:uncharacterized membrane protein YccC
MKLAAVIAFAFALGACSPSEDRRAREQARQTAEQAKHDARVALEQAKIAAEKANRELDKDLHKAREKVRGALNQPNDTPKNEPR